MGKVTDPGLEPGQPYNAVNDMEGDGVTRARAAKVTSPPGSPEAGAAEGCVTLPPARVPFLFASWASSLSSPSFPSTCLLAVVVGALITYRVALAAQVPLGNLMEMPSAAAPVPQQIHFEPDALRGGISGAPPPSLSAAWPSPLAVALPPPATMP